MKTMSKLPSDLLKSALVEGMVDPMQLISSFLYRMSEKEIMDMIEKDFTYLMDDVENTWNYSDKE